MVFLQRYHDRYGKDGLTIVSVALDGPDTSAEVAPYIRKQGYTFRVVLDESGTVTYTQLVPEIAQEPDYDAAIAALG